MAIPPAQPAVLLPPLLPPSPTLFKDSSLYISDVFFITVVHINKFGDSFVRNVVQH